jgi:hypothetical protein
MTQLVQHAGQDLVPVGDSGLPLFTITRTMSIRRLRTLFMLLRNDEQDYIW